jgi:hypothetical protein
MLFPKAPNHTPDLGKVRTNPEVIEQLCKLITELPEGQYQTSHCIRLARICITINRHSFSAPFFLARRIRSGRHGTFSGCLRITMPLPCGQRTCLGAALMWRPQWREGGS